MTILENIKAASLQARKDKNQAKAALLLTLTSDVTMVGKNDGNREPTDVETIAIIKKYIANVNETIKHLIETKSSASDYATALAVTTTEVTKCNNEIQWLNEFLPKQLTEYELEKAVENAIVSLEKATIKDLGKVMKYLKDLYGGQYDGQLASKIAKEKLSV